MTNIKAFVFDLDGTLVDSMGIALKLFQDIISLYSDKTFDWEDLEVIRHRSNNNLFEGYVPKGKEHEAVEKMIAHNKQNSHKIEKVEGIEPILKTIKLSNTPISVWTGRDQTSAVSILKSNGLYDYFDQIVGNCNVNQNKPHPEGLLAASKNFNLPMHSIAHIGDHYHDVQGARDAGAKVIGVHWCESEMILDEIKNGYCKWQGYKPDLEFHCPKDFHNWVKSLDL
jgi:pyrophosphatase PpaX